MNQGVRTGERIVAGGESVLLERMRRGEERLKEMKIEVCTSVRTIHSTVQYVSCLKQQSPITLSPSYRIFHILFNSYIFLFSSTFKIHFSQMLC